MSRDIRIKKGLDIHLEGEANRVLNEAPSSKVIKVIPDDFHGVTPKLLKRAGDEVKAGEGIFYAKSDERIKFVSPVSGELVEVERGAKRKILSLQVIADAEQKAVKHEIPEIENTSAEDLKVLMAEAGLWPLIKQRPFDVMATLDDKPKAIFISAYDSAPLGVDYDFVLKDKEKELQKAFEVLSKLTDGKIHLTISKDSNASVFSEMEGYEIHKAYGPHPVGNVSTQIAKIDPIAKGDIVWVINPADLATIGEFFMTGIFNPEKVVAVCGSEVENPQYIKTIRGAQTKDILSVAGVSDQKNRIISGNVLTGTTAHAGVLHYHDNQITVIPEGDDYDFLGWQRPQPSKPSFYRVDFMGWLLKGKKKLKPNTNTNGEHRAYVLTGNFEKVFPLDIYPLQLLKACMTEDIDAMEQLGMYEVAPEDFALTEFIDVSKHNHQKQIRESLDLMKKELGGVSRH